MMPSSVISNLKLPFLPGVLSPVGLEEVLVSVQRQKCHQFIIGPGDNREEEGFSKAIKIMPRRIL